MSDSDKLHTGNLTPNVNPQNNEQLFDEIADALVAKGYIILDSALAGNLTEDLLAFFLSLNDDAFKRAGIGRQDDFQIDSSVRRDKIHWLQHNHFSEMAFLAWMDHIRLGLNRRLFMGLFDYEFHFAYYGVGAFYKKHLDAFKRSASIVEQAQSQSLQAQTSRVLSTVLYLNRDWQAGDGGELQIYAEDDITVLEKVAPEFGRLVIFLSEKFPHEVLPAQRERYSVAGWFRVNNTTNAVLDPPR